MVRGRVDAADDEVGVAFQKAYQRVYRVVRRIPRGRVMTYGEVAEEAGMPRAARVVGYAMRAAPDGVPWQRVIGKRGPGRGCVTIKDPIAAAVQRQILESEGVRFGDRDSIDLGKYGAGAPKMQKPARRRGPASRKRK